MAKVILHIDLNQFFVRCEELKDPTLINKPVAVGHDGRSGIVSTCSYKAREFGVRSGMPMFQAKKLCPELIVKPVDFRFYGVLSREFFKFVKSYTTLVENASIDECYADFTIPLKGIKDVEVYFKDFQKKLFSKTGLNCSIGIAPNRFLAKMGSDYKKPNGITIVRKKDIEKIKQKKERKLEKNEQKQERIEQKYEEKINRKNEKVNKKLEKLAEKETSTTNNVLD